MTTPDPIDARGAVELPPKTESIRDVLERKHPAYEWLVRIERVISCTLLVALFGYVLLQVFTRYVLNNPLSWTEESARLLLVWLTFMAAGFVSSRRSHITVDLLVAVVPRGVARAVNVLAHLAVIAAAGFLAVAGIAMVVLVDGIRLPATGLPNGLLYSAALIGFTLVLVHTALALYMQLRYPEEEPDPLQTVTEREGL